MSTQPRAWVNLGMHGEYSEMRCRAKVVHPICPQSLVREYNQGQVSLMVHQTRPDQTWNPKPSSRDHHDNYRRILKEYKQNKRKWMGKNNNKPRVSKSGDKLISWLTDLNVRGCKRASECLTFKLQTDPMLSLWSVSRLHPFQYIHTRIESNCFGTTSLLINWLAGCLGWHCTSRACVNADAAPVKPINDHMNQCSQFTCSQTLYLWF